MGRAHAHGIAHRAVGPAEVAAMVPAAVGLPCAGAVHTADDGIIDSTTLLHGYARGARAAGARVVVRCEVEAERDDGAGGVEVVTSAGTVRTGVVACAPGAWAGVVGARDVDFAPMKRHMFFLSQDGAGPAVGDPFVWRVGPSEVYVRNGDDGLMASGCDGARVAPGDVAIDPAAMIALGERLAAAPVLAARPITATWACQRTFAPEGPPRIGWDPERRWWFWVAGLGGHGVTCSAAVGEEAAAALAARLEATR